MVTMSSSALQQQDGGLLSPRRKKRRNTSDGVVPTALLTMAAMTSVVLLLSLLSGRSAAGDAGYVSSHRHLQNNEGDVSSSNPIEEPVLCSEEMNLYCPPKMKCCPKFADTPVAVGRKLSFLKSKTVVGYNCLAASKGKYPIGECCTDEDDTGCSIGYSCAASSAMADDDLAKISHCQRDSTQPVDNDGKLIKFDFERMPRYHTCPARGYENHQPFGLPIPSAVGREVDGGRRLVTGDENIAQLAYYTNSRSVSERNDKVKTAIVTIHGSGRNSMNYLCFMIRAVKDFVATQESTSEEDYLVIAPWFLAPQDGEPETTEPSLPFLKWDDDKPISHTFRYGAESLQVNGATVSSYAAMDVILETLCNKQSFPNLQRIVVTGHSAGGQFVHRWGISSNSPCLDSMNENYPSVKLVAANPRSYAYLDERRYFPTQDEIEENADIADPSLVIDKGEGDTETVFRLRELTSEELDDCPEFNSYEWGLNENSELPAPYIMSNLAPLKNDNEAFCRYASRDVVYLSGERDVEKLGNQICNEDGYQGPTRRQRSERFYSSLQVIGRETGFCGRDDEETDLEAKKVHERVVVKNVGHDHALIYVLEEGQRVLFE